MMVYTELSSSRRLEATGHRQSVIPTPEISSLLAKTVFTVCQFWFQLHAHGFTSNTAPRT
jgi:hypothetical protein